MTTWRVWVAVLSPGELLLTLVAAGLGGCVAQACGCGTDLLGGLAMLLLAVLAQGAHQLHRHLQPSPAGTPLPPDTAALRDLLQGLLIVIGGGLVLCWPPAAGPGRC